MALPFLSQTELQQFAACRAFLVALVPSTTEVILAQVNRVPEPRAENFIVMTPLRLRRLGTNLVTYDDAVFTASIAGSVMDVTALARGTVVAGALLTDGTAGLIAGDTVVVEQLSGSAGGTGAYAVSGSQALAAGTLLGGVRYDLTQTEWTVQVDVHGPSAGDTVQTLVNLFRSEVAVDALEATGYAVAPLSCDDAHQRPFINAEQQYEFRWGTDLVMEVTPVVGTSQQFADAVTVTTVEADALPS